MSYFSHWRRFYWGFVSNMSYWQRCSLKNIVLTAGFPTHGWHSSNIFHLFSIYYWDWDSIGKIIKKIAWLSHKFFVRSVCWEVRPTPSTREIRAVLLIFFTIFEKKPWQYQLFFVYSSMKLMMILIGLTIYLFLGYNYVRGYERKYYDRMTHKRNRIVAVI